MVGDDIETDVLAARRQGLTGVLVKTGKYLPRTHRAAAGTPDHVLDSFAGPARPAGAAVLRGPTRITRSPAACQRRNLVDGL